MIRLKFIQMWSNHMSNCKMENVSDSLEIDIKDVVKWNWKWIFIAVQFNLSAEFTLAHPPWLLLYVPENEWKKNFYALLFTFASNPTHTRVSLLRFSKNPFHFRSRIFISFQGKWEKERVRATKRPENWTMLNRRNWLWPACCRLCLCPYEEE